MKTELSTTKQKKATSNGRQISTIIVDDIINDIDKKLFPNKTEGCFEIGGTVRKRKGNKILKYNLKEISLMKINKKGRENQTPKNNYSSDYPVGRMLEPFDLQGQR